jgi:hypothetical protein
MARVPPKMTDINELMDDGTEVLRAVRMQASDADVKVMLEAMCQGDDGRSQWCWFRLPNGDLIFGCYPQGDTYERVSQQFGMV